MSKLLNRINKLQNLRHQRGAVLMVMLVILIVGGSAMLLNSLNSVTPRLARDSVTSNAMAQAKEALIGYAITYADTHNNVNGFLPCPDQGQNNTVDGETNASCGKDSNGDVQKNISAIGRLPWKTLKISPLKDGNGDCFWYAVSGTYKYSYDADLMNWDSNGLFQIMAPDGVSILTGSSAVNQPVAIIFSPGPPLGTQARTPATNTPSCGGNYVASNYLEHDTVHSINNATTSTTANSITQYISGSVKDQSGNEIVNDRLLIITREDIFNTLKKRNDFGIFVTTSIINQAMSCLAALPNPKTIDFDTMNESAAISHGMMMNQILTGRISSTSCTGAANNAVQKWRDNIAYAKCSTAGCLTINGLSCSGAVVFSGERSLSQNRNTNAQKNNWSNYLEGDALNIFSTGAAAVTGAAIAYNPAATSTDIWGCIL